MTSRQSFGFSAAVIPAILPIDKRAQNQQATTEHLHSLFRHVIKLSPPNSNVAINTCVFQRGISFPYLACSTIYNPPSHSLSSHLSLLSFSLSFSFKIEMIEECRKRPGSVDDVVFEVVGKRPKTPAKSVDDECDYEYYFKFSDDDFYSTTTNELPIKEETIEAVMNLLEKELNDVRNASIKMKETCGVTFSDESSTVMASIDLCGMFNISYLNESFPFQSVFYTSSTPLPLPVPPPTLPFTQLAKSQLSCSSVNNNNNQQREFEVCYSNVDLVNRIGVTEQEDQEEQVSGSDETNGFEEHVVSTGTANETNAFDDQESTADDLNDDQWMDLLTLDGFSFDL